MSVPTAASLDLRRLVSGDAATIACTHVAAFDNPWTAAALAAILADPVCFGWSCEDPSVDLPAGFILARVAAGEAEILTLAVLPEMRRRGLGRALLSAALAEAAQRGARRIFLEVADDNEAACALYLDCGFAEIGRRSAYYGRPGGRRRDALVFTRPLDERVDAVSGDF